MSSLSSSSTESPAWKAKRIGFGAFGQVYALEGRSMAFKVTTFESAKILEKEFEIIRTLYVTSTSTGSDSPSLFVIPRPYGYYKPKGEDSAAKFEDVPASQTSTKRTLGPPLTAEDAEQLSAMLPVQGPMCAMDLIMPIPLSIAPKIRRFYPKGSDKLPDPRLCRLWFGKVIEESRLLQVNTDSFPLDVERYTVVSQKDDAFPTAEEVALGMGVMLSRIHWRAGYSGRDIEFVMGGLDVGSLGFYCIDFNQVGLFILILPCLLTRSFSLRWNSGIKP